MAEQINLHSVEALQEVQVRDDIYLRPLAEHDGPQLLATLEADPDIGRRVFVAGRIHSQADLQDEIADIAKETGLIRYALTNKADNFLGLVSFWRDDGFFGQTPLEDAYGFGYFLSPEARGQGLVAAAVKRLMEVAQDELTVSEFVAFCEDDNQKSISVLEGLGFCATDQSFPEIDGDRIERKYAKPVLLAQEAS